MAYGARNRARVRLGLIGAFAVLLCACALVVIAAFSSSSADRLVEHSIQVRQTLQQLLATVQEAESAQRGYLLTGDDGYAAPFQQAKAQLPVLEAQLRQLIEQSAMHQRRRMTPCRSRWPSSPSSP